MARTFAHRPYWVRYTDASVCFEVHDHRDGRCDLEPLDVWFARVRDQEKVWRAGACRWEVDLYATGPICGCNMCTGQEDRIFKTRADRRQTAQRLRAVVLRGDPDVA